MSTTVQLICFNKIFIEKTLDLRVWWDKLSLPSDPQYWGYLHSPFSSRRTSCCWRQIFIFSGSSLGTVGIGEYAEMVIFTVTSQLTLRFYVRNLTVQHTCIKNHILCTYYYQFSKSRLHYLKEGTIPHIPTSQLSFITDNKHKN